MCGKSSLRLNRRPRFRPLGLAGSRARIGRILKATGDGGTLAGHQHIAASGKPLHNRNAFLRLITSRVMTMASSTVTFGIVEGIGCVKGATLRRPRVDTPRFLSFLVHAGPLLIATRAALLASASLTFNFPASDPLRARCAVTVGRRFAARSRAPLRTDTILVSSILDTAAV